MASNPNRNSLRMVEVDFRGCNTLFTIFFFLEFLQECWRGSHVSCNADFVPYHDSVLGLSGFPNSWVLGTVSVERKSCF